MALPNSQLNAVRPGMRGERLDRVKHDLAGSTALRVGLEAHQHPRQVLSEGEEINVRILNVDRERERIDLSGKRLLQDPWPLVIDVLHTG